MDTAAFSSIDADNDNVWSLKELTAFQREINTIMNSNNVTDEDIEVIDTYFAVFDINYNGYITRSEFLNIICLIEFNKFDKNSNQNICFDELIDGLDQLYTNDDTIKRILSINITNKLVSDANINACATKLFHNDNARRLGNDFDCVTLCGWDRFGRWSCGYICFPLQK